MPKQPQTQICCNGVESSSVKLSIFCSQRTNQNSTFIYSDRSPHNDHHNCSCTNQAGQVSYFNAGTTTLLPNLNRQPLSNALQTILIIVEGDLGKAQKLLSTQVHQSAFSHDGSTFPFQTKSQLILTLQYSDISLF